jgi:hypothetical protein
MLPVVDASSMESSAKFSHAGLDGKVDLFGEGKVTVGKDTVSVQGSGPSPCSLPVRDIKWLKAVDYRIELGTVSGSLMLFELGYRFEDVLRAVHAARNETRITDSLVYESPKGPGVTGTVAVYEKSGTQLFEGPGEVRLYETALVIMPQMSSLVRMRYSDIGSIASNDYSLELADERGTKVSIKMLGRQHEPLLNVISDQVGDIKLRSRNMIKSMHPGISDGDLSKMSVLMREGKAASFEDINEISPPFMTILEKRLGAELPDSYQVLIGKGRKEMTRYGFKSGMMDGVTGDHVWFLIPIFSNDPSVPGNAIAFDASGNDSTRATYFFRIMGRMEYADCSTSELLKAVGSTLERTMDALTEINFRREPIYLEEGDLLKEEHAHYRYAIDALPGLRDLRERFIGRIPHGSAENYQKDLDNLLTFNIKARTESERWDVSGNGQPK